eukprot:gene61070-83534_t
MARKIAPTVDLGVSFEYEPRPVIAVFPKADHGIVETFQSQGVSHVRSAPGYLDLVAGWMRDGRVHRIEGVNIQPARRQGTSAQ